MGYNRGYGRVPTLIRISVPYFESVFTALSNIDRLTETDKIVDSWGILYPAQQQIDALLNASIYSTSLRSCRTTATDFLTAVREVMNESDLMQEIGQYRHWRVRHSRDQMRTALLAELGVIPTYFVSQKEGYDTLSLLDNGLALFPPSLAVKAPEAIFDALEAGKALAFELSTAVGFHVFRALEAVLRRYHREVTGGGAPPKLRTISVYLRSMKDLQVGDPRIIAALDQIRDLHRNPVAHPEAVLDLDAAISLVGIARSAIGAMLAALPDAPLTTAVAPTIRIK